MTIIKNNSIKKYKNEQLVRVFLGISKNKRWHLTVYWYSFFDTS